MPFVCIGRRLRQQYEVLTLWWYIGTAAPSNVFYTKHGNRQQQNSRTAATAAEDAVAADMDKFRDFDDSCTAEVYTEESLCKVFQLSEGSRHDSKDWLRAVLRGCQQSVDLEGPLYRVSKDCANQSLQNVNW